MMTEPLVEVVAAARAVADRLADLDGYIERRAQELAAPAIAKGEAAAAEIERCIAAAEDRLSDLQREFGRHIAALEHRIWKQKTEFEELRSERDRLQREADKEIRSA